MSAGPECDFVWLGLANRKSSQEYYCSCRVSALLWGHHVKMKWVPSSPDLHPESRRQHRSMVVEEITIALSGGAPWGFRLQGGAEHQRPLQVAKVWLIWSLAWIMILAKYVLRYLFLFICLQVRLHAYASIPKLHPLNNPCEAKDETGRFVSGPITLWTFNLLECTAVS